MYVYGKTAIDTSPGRLVSRVNGHPRETLETYFSDRLRRSRPAVSANEDNIEQAFVTFYLLHNNVEAFRCAMRVPAVQ